MSTISSGFALPFTVRLSKLPLLSVGLAVRVDGRLKGAVEVGPDVVGEVLDLFTQLAQTGALGGVSQTSRHSTFALSAIDLPEQTSFTFSIPDCRLDERALVVLCHLFLARCNLAPLALLTLSTPGQPPESRLSLGLDDESTFPLIVPGLPFAIDNEEPESGGYTFTAVLDQQVDPANAGVLSDALRVWVRALLAGAYALAPISPEESYAEADADEVTFFDSTVEWTVFKVRADPACIDGIVNIFAAFHYRCQAIKTLTIS